jgi:nickel-dependent lactate racemase
VEDKARIAQRIADALKYFGGFVYQDSLDRHEEVMSVVREAGLAFLLNTVVIDRKQRIYALLLNDKRCQVQCAHSSGCPEDDDTCKEKCLENCRKELIDKIVEALNRYAERVRRKP